MLFKPFSVSDKSRRSSAQIKQLSGNVGFIFTGSHSVFSTTFCRSERKMLNKSGLRIHPCLTPCVEQKVSVILFPIFTQDLSPS